jgi:Cu/Ag efflux protein CusF
MPRRFALLLLVLLAACTREPEPKRYPIQGEVKALDPAVKSATISHGAIGDWMGPMTMEFPVKPDADFQKLHVGDRIEGTVVVAGDSRYHVTAVKIVQAASAR